LFLLAIFHLKFQQKETETRCRFEENGDGAEWEFGTTSRGNCRWASCNTGGHDYSDQQIAT
jgi:hypothetical protein